MKHRFAGFAVLTMTALSLCRCSNCPDPSSFQAKLENAASDAAYWFAKSTLGQFSGPPPARAGTVDDPRCNAVNSAGPDYQPAALTSPPSADICSASHDVDDPCPACVLANCCTEIVACVNEYTCTCRLARRTPGANWPEDAECDAADKVTDDAAACLSAHCADVCPMTQ